MRRSRRRAGCQPDAVLLALQLPTSSHASIPQQVVDAGLGAGLGVDRLDDQILHVVRLVGVDLAGHTGSLC